MVCPVYLVCSVYSVYLVCLVCWAGPEGFIPTDQAGQAINREQASVTISERPRILICRLSAVGDSILTLPVLCALRARFPGAFLGWVVQEGAASLLRNHKSLDRTIVVKSGWMSSLKEIRCLRRELRALEFDIAIDVQSLTKSAVAAWLSSARQRVGFAPPQGRELAPWFNRTLIKATKTHVVDRYLELLKPLGIENPSVSFEVPEDSVAKAAVDRLLQEAGIRGPFAVFSPGAGWPSKIWPADRYRPLSEHLHKRYGLKTVVLWSGEQERVWAESIVAGCEQYRIVAPRTTLPELAAFLKRAELFVGPDTGPLHLAVAVGTSSVALFGPTDEAICGPYGTGHIVVRATEVSGISMRSASDEAIRAITVEAVARACDDMLERKKE